MEVLEDFEEDDEKNELQGLLKKGDVVKLDIKDGETINFGKSEAKS